MNTTQPAEAPVTTRWDRAKGEVQRQVDQLNAALHYSTGMDDPHVTVGYIGNGRMSASGWDLRGVRWYVFLPHPGRVGKDDDSLGGVAHGDADGMFALAGQVATFRKGVLFAGKAGAR